MGHKARPQVELYEAYIQKSSLAISDISHFRRVHVRRQSVGSRGAVVSAALSERKVAGSIPTIGDFHTVIACLATDVK